MRSIRLWASTKFRFRDQRLRHDPRVRVAYFSEKALAVSLRSLSRASRRSAGSLAGSVVIACNSRLSLSAVGVKITTVPDFIADLALAGTACTCGVGSAIGVAIGLGFVSILTMAMHSSWLSTQENGSAMGVFKAPEPNSGDQTKRIKMWLI